MSWIDESELPVLTVKYEDLINRTFESFSEVLQFIEWDYSKKEINKAIEYSRIEELQSQELEDGFREKPLRAATFFRSGKIGSWKDLLDEDQVRMIYDQNKIVMERFGYSIDNQALY